MPSQRTKVCMTACMVLAALCWTTAAQSQTVFKYHFPASWDGISSTVTDLSAAGNDATLSGLPALSSTIPSGAIAGTQSLSSAGGGFHTTNNGLLSNTLVEANGGYSYEVYFYWDGTATAYPTQKIIDYAGTESLHLQNINTGAGTADLLFGFDDAVEGPAQSINANTWYKVSAVFDTQSNTIDGSGNLAGLATLTVNAVSTSASVTKTTQGDNLNRPIGVGTLPSGSGLVNFSGFIYNPQVTLGLPSLVGHYRLDETAGTVAVDSSGLDNDGTYVNDPTLGVTGIRDNAAELNMADTDDRIDLPYTVLDGAMDASFAFWIKTAYTGNTGVLAGANTGQTNAFVVFFVNSTTLSLYKGTNNVNVTIPTVADNEWHHFVWTWDGDTNTTTLYRNGLLVSSQVMAGTVGVPIDIDLGGFLLGQEQDCVGGCFSSSQVVQGSLDDIWIYRSVLTAEEVAVIYSGLMGHWKLDETSGTVAADSSGIGNDASYNNGVTLNSPGPYPGVGAIAAEFDGVNDQVWVPHHDAYDVTEAVTVATWVKFDTAVSLQTDGINLLDRNDWSNKEGYTLVVNQPYTNEVLFRILGGGSYADAAWSGDNFAADTWYHVAGTFDGITVRLYVNGSLVASTPFVSNIGVPAGLGIALGWQHDGAMHDMRLYNRALTDTQIAELYGLMGHWKMDEGAGLTAADSTVFANDASIYGATWTTDCSGNNGLEFDGLGDTAATNSIFDPPEDGSIAVWLRSAGNPGARSRPFGVGGNWEMRQEPDGTLSFDLGGEGPDEGAGGDEFTTNDGLSFEDRWYHVIAQFDADDDSFEIYINGELVKSGVNGDDMTKQLANTLSFGTRTGSTEYWEGAIRDFRVYNRWLTGSEISELSGLVGYWKLDETSGTVAVDSSPGGNDGTFATGSPTWTTAGQIAGALDFESSDGADRVDVGNFVISGSQLSLSAWVRPEEGSNEQRIIIKSNSNVDTQQFWGLAVDESNEPDFRIQAGGVWDSVSYANGVTPGKWYHLAGTYDGTTMRLYVNGVEIASKAHSAGGPINDGGSAPVVLGNSPVGGRPYDGRLDDVRVFSRVMCPEEVFGQYRGGRPAGVRILQWVEVR